MVNTLSIFTVSFHLLDYVSLGHLLSESGDFLVTCSDHLLDRRLFSRRSDVVHDSLRLILSLVERDHLILRKLRSFICLAQHGTLAGIAKIFDSIIKDFSLLTSDSLLKVTVGPGLFVIEEANDAVLVRVNNDFVSPSVRQCNGELPKRMHEVKFSCFILFLVFAFRLTLLGAHVYRLIES